MRHRADATRADTLPRGSSVPGEAGTSRPRGLGPLARIGLAVLVSVGAVAMPIPALAATSPAGQSGTDAKAAARAVTAVSTVSKTGTDPSTGSTATSGGTAGTANPGDTINWVVNYNNSTGDRAKVTVNDPIPAGQSLVAGSLKQPPGWGLTAGGGAISGSTANVRSTGGADLTFVSNGNALNSGSGGDGFNVVINAAQPNNVYTAFHHGLPSITCVDRTSSSTCSSWPQNVLYFDPANPTGPLLTSAPAGDPLGAAYQNWTTLDQASGRIFEQAYTQTPTPTVEILCYNTVTRAGCGVIQPTTNVVILGSPTGAQFTASSPHQGANGWMYWSSYNAAGLVTQHCFVPATGAACPSGDGITLFPAGTGNSALPDPMSRYNSQVYGKYIFTVLENSSSTTSLQCFDTSTNALCAGWPAAGKTAASIPSPELGPILDAGGNVTGVCNVSLNTTTPCFSTSGAPVATPAIYNQPIGSAFAPFYADYFQQIVPIGSKVYYDPAGSPVLCFDFATNAACAGYTAQGGTPASYTLVQDASNPECIWQDGDTGALQPIDAVTGTIGCGASATVTATPAANDCDGKPHPIAWSGLTLAAPPSSQFTSSAVTVKDANGQVVTDSSGVVWSNHTLPSTTNPIDLSKIGYGTAWSNGLGGTFNTTTLTVTLVLEGPKGAFTPAPAATLTWTGDSTYQVCYQTKVDPTCQALAFPVADSATITTDATAVGGPTDGPGGNSSGTATFNVVQSAATCALTTTKTASSATVEAGSKVTYTVKITNSGSANQPNASMSDVLPGVPAQAAYNGDAKAQIGGSPAPTQPTYDPSTNKINWSGSLTAGQSVTLTYSLTVDSPPKSGAPLVNTVVVPGSNCAAGSSDPTCTTTTTLPALTITKKASPTTPVTAGQKVTYTITIANTTATPYTGANITDNLSGVLDVATWDNDLTASSGTATLNGQNVVWTGDVPANGTVTVTYSVTAH